MRCRWIAVLGVAALMGCGGPGVTPTVNIAPTATNTAVPVTATMTPAPPTATALPPTATSVPPTATATALPPTPTTKPPTATPLPPQPPVPTATPTPVPFRTGGFGQTRAEWERTNHQPEREAPSGFFLYSNGIYVVSYRENGRMFYLERSWGSRDLKSLDFATGAMKSFLPSDAKLVRTYTAPSGNTVDLYHSAALATVFPAEEFAGGDPGDFMVIYRNASGKVSSFLIATGNNP